MNILIGCKYAFVMKDFCFQKQFINYKHILQPISNCIYQNPRNKYII